MKRSIASRAVTPAFGGLRFVAAVCPLYSLGADEAAPSEIVWVTFLFKIQILP